MFLHAQSANGASQTSMLGALIPFVIIFAIFYLLIIMPARKKQKQHQSMVGALRGGERVVTAGGVFGTVTRVMEDRIEIQVDANTKLQVTKGSISTVLDPTGGEKK
jgi:preprotein translocase subunit YajC